jgi:Head domain of trimeric autotransporter adhesin
LGYGTMASRTGTTAIGYQTTASGVYSTAMGYQTNAKALGSFVVGNNNDNTDNPDPNNPLPLDRIFQIGNGNFVGTRSNALTILRNGNVGIGTPTPGFLLSFPDALGDKISLFGNSGAHYGFGIQNSLLQVHSSASAEDIAFGYGSSNSFTETMRIKGNGNVGIGTSNPAFKLDVADRMRIRSGGGFSTAGLYLNSNDNSQSPAFIGMDDDTHVGFWGSGVGWRFSMNTNNGALKINGSEGSAGQLLKSNGSSSSPAWNTLGSILQTYKSSSAPQQSFLLSSVNPNYIFFNNEVVVNVTQKSRLIISAMFDLDPDFCPAICPAFGASVQCKVLNSANQSQAVDSVQLKGTVGSGGAGNATISNFMVEITTNGGYIIRFSATRFSGNGYSDGRVTAKFSSVMVLPID